MSQKYAKDLPITILFIKNTHCLKALMQETLIWVDHIFVIFCIDYCNSLLYVISDYNINRLRQTQNNAARLVANTQIYYHISSQFFKLH